MLALVRVAVDCVAELGAVGCRWLLLDDDWPGLRWRRGVLLACKLEIGHLSIGRATGERHAVPRYGTW